MKNGICKLRNLILFNLYVILFISGILNLLNYKREVSLFNISYELFMLPIAYMCFVATGFYLGAKLIKHELRS